MMVNKLLECALMARNDFGEKFIRLLDLYRKPDGSRWSMAEIEQSTDKFVKSSYLANLKAGRIQQPGLDRLRAIASVMGVPVELWLQRSDQWEIAEDQPVGGGTFTPGTLAKNLNLLFDVLTNERTGKSYTEADVAAASEGELTEQDVRAIRKGHVEDLRGAQYLALSKVFDIDINYWYQGTGSYGNPERNGSSGVGRCKDSHYLKQSLRKSREAEGRNSASTGADGVAKRRGTARR